MHLIEEDSYSYIYIEEKLLDEENLSNIFNFNIKEYKLLIKNKSKFYINTKLQLFLKHLFDRFPNHHKLIKSIYKLYSSKYYCILKLKILNSRYKIVTKIWFLKNLSLEDQLLIQSWLPLIDIQLLSESWWLVWIQSWENKHHIIDWEHLSKNLGKSTNKGWAQSNKVTNSKTIEAKKLFCYKLLDLLYQHKYIVNINMWWYWYSQAGLFLISKTS